MLMPVVNSVGEASEVVTVTFEDGVVAGVVTTFVLVKVGKVVETGSAVLVVVVTVALTLLSTTAAGDITASNCQMHVDIFLTTGRTISVK